ncbi:MAG: hypothetical protein ABFR62_09410 [Bacteroidota bacterium]
MALDNKIKYIEELVEKYYEGQTSMKEEETLRDFFTNEDVPTHLMYEKAQFTYYNEESKLTNDIEFEDLNIENQPKKRSKIFRFINYAAAAALLISAGWFSNMKYQEHLKEQRELKIAYAETQKAMELLASNFNIGLEHADALKEMNKTQKLIIDKNY